MILLLILWISKHCWKSFRLSHTTIETKTNFKHAFLASGSNDFPLTYKRSWLEKNVSFFTKYPTSNPQTDTHTHTHTHTHCHRNVHWLCKSKPKKTTEIKYISSGVGQPWLKSCLTSLIMWLWVSDLTCLSLGFSFCKNGGEDFWKNEKGAYVWSA